MRAGSACAASADWSRASECAISSAGIAPGTDALCPAMRNSVVATSPNIVKPPTSLLNLTSMTTA